MSPSWPPGTSTSTRRPAAHGNNDRQHLRCRCLPPSRRTATTGQLGTAPARRTDIQARGAAPAGQPPPARASADSRGQLVVELLARTGMRAGELADLLAAGPRPTLSLSFNLRVRAVP